MGAIIFAQTVPGKPKPHRGCAGPSGKRQARRGKRKGQEIYLFVADLTADLRVDQKVKTKPERFTERFTVRPKVAGELPRRSRNPGLAGGIP